MRNCGVGMSLCVRRRIVLSLGYFEGLYVVNKFSKIRAPTVEHSVSITDNDQRSPCPCDRNIEKILTMTAGIDKPACAAWHGAAYCGREEHNIPFISLEPMHSIAKKFCPSQSLREFNPLGDQLPDTVYLRPERTHDPNRSTVATEDELFNFRYDSPRLCFIYRFIVLSKLCGALDINPLNRGLVWVRNA